MKKILLDNNVLEAAQERIAWLFETFGKICISFSGGKDSTTMLHLTAEVAKRKKRTFSVMFIDWEVQYSYTINHVEHMRQYYRDFIDDFYWIALPMTTVNGVSQHQPLWTSWEKDTPWVRQPPEHAITDETFFPFYSYGMEFESFVPLFSRWFSGNKPAAILIGIRTDESLNRYRTIVSLKKLRYADDKPWTTASPEGFYYNAYPLYDWKVKDIWLYYSLTGRPVNPVYELMYKAGVPPNNMRICEPYGPEQRQGLWLYHILEPDTWSRASERVNGANSGALHGKGYSKFYARRKFTRPDTLTWKKYAFVLLDSMPVSTAEHYKNKIAIYLHWYQSRDYPEDIPDEQNNDLGVKDIPSWRRICKCLLKNDYWCRLLSFSPTKNSAYDRYCARVQHKRKQWKIL